MGIVVSQCNSYNKQLPYAKHRCLFEKHLSGSPANVLQSLGSFIKQLPHCNMSQCPQGKVSLNLFFFFFLFFQLWSTLPVQHQWLNCSVGFLQESETEITSARWKMWKNLSLDFQLFLLSKRRKTRRRQFQFSLSEQEKKTPVTK